MKRRTALKGLVTAGLLPGTALAEELMGRAQAKLQSTSLQDRFARALQLDKSWLGYRTVQQADQHTPAARLLGKWPEQLRGSLYRNGPGQHEIGDFRYAHWFDGDGLVQAWHLNESGIEHRARLVRTRKYLAEKAAGRPLYPGFGTLPPNAQGTPSPDHSNPANISVLHHHNRLFALWEAGSAYEMDKQNIKTVGEVSFSEETAGAPFSAHPRVEADGTLWNFGYVSGLKKLVLWHLNAQGKVVKTGLVDCDPISMVHDFVVTAKHLVVLVCPLDFEPSDSAENFLDMHRWHPERATQVLVIDKNDFSKVQRLELPAQWIFHFSNAWEDATGVIRFEAASAATPEILSTTFRSVMAGEHSVSTPTHLLQYRIDTKAGTVQQDTLRGNGSCEFPVIDAPRTGKRHERILLLSDAKSPHPSLNQVTMLNPLNGSEVSYRYPDHLIPEEHLLIGKPTSPTRSANPGAAPWVLGTALNYRDSRSELHLFAADDLAGGPIASALLPYALPLGLHGKFVETI